MASAPGNKCGWGREDGGHRNWGFRECRQLSENGVNLSSKKMRRLKTKDESSANAEIHRFTSALLHARFFSLLPGPPIIPAIVLGGKRNRVLDSLGFLAPATPRVHAMTILLHFARVIDVKFYAFKDVVTSNSR